MARDFTRAEEKSSDGPPSNPPMFTPNCAASPASCEPLCGGELGAKLASERHPRSNNVALSPATENKRLIATIHRRCRSRALTIRSGDRETALASSEKGAYEYKTGPPALFGSIGSVMCLRPCWPCGGMVVLYAGCASSPEYRNTTLYM